MDTYLTTHNKVMCDDIEGCPLRSRTATCQFFWKPRDKVGLQIAVQCNTKCRGYGNSGVVGGRGCSIKTRARTIAIYTSSLSGPFSPERLTPERNSIELIFTNDTTSEERTLS